MERIVVKMVGYVNSFQSAGTVDGPGVRCVVFMQGCPLRCAYCHNPDTWEFGKGYEYTAEEMAKKILRYKPYISSGGGVTVSGGEALSQWEFVAELFRLLKSEGIHTALDTSGVGNIDGSKKVLEYTDLVICDIKFPTMEKYQEYCKGNINTVLKFLALVDKMKIPLWIRHVVVPTLTDTAENIKQISLLAHQFSVLEKLELLEFRKLCLPKYENMGIEFPLKNVPEMGRKELENLYQYI